MPGGEGQGPSLQERLAAAKEAGQKREEQTLNKIESKRGAVSSKIENAIAATKKAVEDFRAKDKQKTIEAVGTMRALPEMGKILKDEAVDRSKKKIKELWGRAVNKGKEIKESLEDTRDDVLLSMFDAVVDVEKAFAKGKAETSAFLEEKRGQINSAVDKGKEAVAHAWRETKAAPVDFRADALDRKEGENAEKNRRDAEKKDKLTEKAKERRDRAAEIRKTKVAVAAAMDEATPAPATEQDAAQARVDNILGPEQPGVVRNPVQTIE